MDRNMLRRRYIAKLEGLLWDGEITDDEYDEMLGEWDRGYDAAMEEAWEAGNDR